MVEVPGGPRLEGLLGLAPEGRGGLVICHPHPLYGGDMDNPVVVRAAEVAREAGISTLRFNFRGVGGSGGSYDEGRGEQEDVTAALALLRTCLPPGRPLGLAGYSFGAWVAALVAARGNTDLAALGLIAPPLRMFDWRAPDGAGLEMLVVAGTRDPYCAVSDVEEFRGRLPGAHVALIEGADHFFFGKLYPLGAAVRTWVGRWARP